MLINLTLGVEMSVPKLVYGFLVGMVYLYSNTDMRS